MGAVTMTKRLFTISSRDLETLDTIKAREGFTDRSQALRYAIRLAGAEDADAENIPAYVADLRRELNELRALMEAETEADGAETETETEDANTEAEASSQRRASANAETGTETAEATPSQRRASQPSASSASTRNGAGKGTEAGKAKGAPSKDAPSLRLTVKQAEAEASPYGADFDKEYTRLRQDAKARFWLAKYLSGKASRHGRLFGSYTEDERAAIALVKPHTDTPAKRAALREYIKAKGLDAPAK